MLDTVAAAAESLKNEAPREDGGPLILAGSGRRICCGDVGSRIPIQDCGRGGLSRLGTWEDETGSAACFLPRLSAGSDFADIMTWITTMIIAFQTPSSRCVRAYVFYNTWLLPSFVHALRRF